MYPGEIARRTPDKPAYVFASGAETVTYGQLDERSNQGARLLRQLGLRTGDGIALMMENHPRFFEICWAAQRSGLIYTTISSRLTAPEVEYIVHDCGARVFIGSHAMRDVAAGIRSSLSGLTGRYLVGDPIEGFESYQVAVADQPAEPISDETEGTDMLYSSGTTGRPKGIKTPFESKPIGTPSTMIGLLKGLYSADEDSVYLSPAPLYHAAPLRFNMAMLRLGATCVLMESFDAVEAIRLIERHRVTVSQWVPSMFVRMFKLSEEERSRHDLSSLKSAIHAAAPCPIEIKQQMIDWWGEVIVEYYAASEGIGVTIIDSAGWLSHRGSVGPAMVGELHILDDEGNELPAGEIGTIYFGGNENKFEYYDEPDKTSQAYNDKGWATTGDVGYVDEDGFLYLTDRKNFMIISGGVNIYPQEIENLLITHEKVADVAVFGIPHPEFGESVHAVVQPMNWVDATDEVAIELMEWARERLSKVKVPRSLHFNEKLPRMDNGKMYKRRLVEEYKGGTRPE